MTLIVPPLLPADWYIRQLRQRDPRLKIPFDYYDGEKNNLKKLVEANPGRPIAVIGQVSDNSLEDDYKVYSLGIVNLLEPKSKPITLAEMVNDNERLMKQYRPPPFQTVNTKSFETEILDLYTHSPLRIGNEYEHGGWNTEARAWYQRALAIDPHSTGARLAFERTK